MEKKIRRRIKFVDVKLGNILVELSMFFGVGIFLFFWGWLGINIVLFYIYNKCLVLKNLNYGCIG